MSGVGKPRLPPGPRLMALSVIALARDVYSELEHLRGRYGDTFTLPLAPRLPMVMTGDPRGVRQIFLAPPDSVTPSTPKTFGPLMGRHSLFLLEGEPHARARQLIGPALHAARVSAFASTIAALTRRHVAAARVGEVVSVNHILEELALDIIVRVVFGAVEPDQVAAYQHAISRFLGAYSTPLALLPALRHSVGPLGPWASFVQARRAFLELVEEDIRTAGERDGRADVLSTLQLARDEEGRPMSTDEVRDELVTLLLAGHETTVRALGWAVYFLHRSQNAGVRSQLERELDRNHPELDVAVLPLLDAVCLETLRLNPVVNWVDRQVTRPFDLLEWRVPTGGLVAACVFLVHRRPDVYPDPCQFRPTRFLERRYGPYEFLPFGGGARRCIGQAFALFVMKVVLATLLSTIRLELEDADSIRPRRHGAAVGPGGDLRMRVVAVFQ